MPNYHSRSRGMLPSSLGRMGASQICACACATNILSEAVIQEPTCGVVQNWPLALHLTIEDWAANHVSRSLAQGSEAIVFVKRLIITCLVGYVAYQGFCVIAQQYGLAY